jgi:dolichol-phosphate mannosyltransferase
VSGETERGGRELTLLSVVAPACNEQELIVEFHRRVVTALEGLPFELILVDDGSVDDTPRLLREIAAADERVRVVTLSRNFGHQAAITAGLDRARGEATVMIDADLQDPPEVIGEMVAAWRNGADVAYGVRRERAGETRFKLWTARWFYGLMSKLSQVPIERNAGDFRLLDRNALNSLNSMRERDRFIRGMTSWIGFNQVPVPYDRDARFAGETKYTTRRMIRFSLDAISSFSNVPLQAATILGFIFSAIAFLAIPVAIGFRIAGEFVPGIATVLLVVLLLGGIQLITVGIIGEYLGRVYDEVKRRPLYVVDERHVADPVHTPPSHEPDEL